MRAIAARLNIIKSTLSGRPRSAGSARHDSNRPEKNAAIGHFTPSWVAPPGLDECPARPLNGTQRMSRGAPCGYPTEETTIRRDFARQYRLLTLCPVPRIDQRNAAARVVARVASGHAGAMGAGDSDNLADRSPGGDHSPGVERGTTATDRQNREAAPQFGFANRRKIDARLRTH